MRFFPDPRIRKCPYRSSSGRSGIRERAGHKTCTTKARRSDILHAAGEASSEANQPVASSQDATRKSQEVPNCGPQNFTDLAVEWRL